MHDCHARIHESSGDSYRDCGEEKAITFSERPEVERMVREQLDALVNQRKAELRAANAQLLREVTERSADLKIKVSRKGKSAA